MLESFTRTKNELPKPEPPAPAPVPPVVTEHAAIGSLITIKGEISGDQPLFIDGNVEGKVSVPNHRVTISRSSKVTADVVAHDLVVMGSLHGNVTCGDLLDVRFESSLAGDITARRVRIDEGAMLKGHVEVHAENVKSESDEVPAQKPLVKAAAAAAGEPMPAENSSIKPVRGSSVLLETTRR